MDSDSSRAGGTGRRPVEDLPIDLVRTEVLGRASVLHLCLGDASFSIAVEPPMPPAACGRATIVVPDVGSGAAILERVARWQRVPVPPKPRGTEHRPLPASIPAVAFQSDADGKVGPCHRARLSFGVDEKLGLIWPESGPCVWFSEVAPEARRELVDELARVFRDGRRATSRDQGDESGRDALRSDPVPLVSSLVRTHRHPASSAASFWRGDRFVFTEDDGERTSVVEVGLDGTAQVMATLDAPAISLDESGPRLVATVECDRSARGAYELWIVESGTQTGRRLLGSEGPFRFGQFAKPIASPDGSLLAVNGWDSREGGDFESTRVLRPDGSLVAELAESETNLRAVAWTADGLELVADRSGKPDGRRCWKPRTGHIETLPDAAEARPFSVSISGTDGLEVRDASSGQARLLAALRRRERERLAKYGESALQVRYLGDRHAVIDVGDRILLDCATLQTWVLFPSLMVEGCVVAAHFSPDLSAVAVVPDGGELFLGRVDDRWRTGGPPPAEDPSAVVGLLREIIEGGRFVFGGVRSDIIPADWAARLSLSEAEIVRRLQAAGEAHIERWQHAIEAAVKAWRSALGTQAAREAANMAASIDLPGAPGVVWAAIANPGAVALDGRGVEAIGLKLKRLAADAFLRTLRPDARVRDLLTREAP